MIHREALTPRAQQLFSLLPRFDNFYLAGGTALALQLGHRISVDFDLFSPTKISPALLPHVQQVFSASGAVSVNNADELTLFIDGVKLTFLYYPFPLIIGLVQEEGVVMLSVAEIAATKAYTIGRRGTYKDYVDLYVILKERHASLEEVIALAKRKYGAEFNGRLFLEQLVYLDDVEDTDIMFLKEPVAKDRIAAFLEAAVKRLKL